MRAPAVVAREAASRSQPGRFLRGGPAVPLLILPACLLVASFVAVIFFLVVQSFTHPDIDSHVSWANYAKLFSNDFFISKIALSMRLAAWSTLGCLLLGYPVAYYMTVTSAARRRFIVLFLVLLFFSDYVMRMYGLVLLLGNNGFVNQALIALDVQSSPSRILRTELGVVIGLVAGQVPFMIFAVFSVLARINPSLPQSALLLGASPARTVLTIILPLSASGVVSGAVIVFLMCLNSYVTPALLGGGFVDMIANEIYDQAISMFRIPLAAASATILLILSLTILAVVNLISARLLPRVGD
jgi:putative spermidine/putrescine transport system permease protein